MKTYLLVHNGKSQQMTKPQRDNLFDTGQIYSCDQHDDATDEVMIYHIFNEGDADKIIRGLNA